MRCVALTPPPEGPGSVATDPVPEAEVEDLLATIADIHNQAYRADAGFTHASADDHRESLRGAALWVTRRAGAIVAFAAIERDPGSVWLESIAVLPSVQGAGIGETLARRALLAEGMGRGYPAGLSVSSGDDAILYLGPDREPALVRAPACANQQERPSFAGSVRRLAAAQRALDEPGMTLAGLLSRFLAPPLHSRMANSPTVYTAVYRPTERCVDYVWPGKAWPQAIGAFTPGAYEHDYGDLTA